MRNESAGNLSIGAMRRVELARAIVEEPKLLLLDEPTSGLEESEIEQLGVILGEMRSSACAVLLIEHHLPLCSSIVTSSACSSWARPLLVARPKRS